jgi:hypothetical protein
MITSTLGDPHSGGVTFSLARVTGMKTPDDWHNTGLTVRQDADGRLTHHWTWTYKGKNGITEFHYTRSH